LLFSRRVCVAVCVTVDEVGEGVVIPVYVTVGGRHDLVEKSSCRLSLAPVFVAGDIPARGLVRRIRHPGLRVPHPTEQVRRVVQHRVTVGRAERAVVAEWSRVGRLRGRPGTAAPLFVERWKRRRRRATQIRIVSRYRNCARLRLRGGGTAAIRGPAGCGGDGYNDAERGDAGTGDYADSALPPTPTQSRTDAEGVFEAAAVQPSKKGRQVGRLELGVELGPAHQFLDAPDGSVGRVGVDRVWPFGCDWLRRRRADKNLSISHTSNLLENRSALHICMYVCMYVYVCICMYMYVCMHINHSSCHSDEHVSRRGSRPLRVGTSSLPTFPLAWLGLRRVYGLGGWYVGVFGGKQHASASLPEISTCHRAGRNSSLTPTYLPHDSHLVRVRCRVDGE
jgi:hypothetical protein